MKWGQSRRALKAVLRTLDIFPFLDLHRTIQLQLLQHYWLGCRLGVL